MILLAEVIDNWTSTQHGDHRNEVAIVNLDNIEPGIPSAFWNAHRGDGLAYVTNEGIPAATRRIGSSSAASAPFWRPGPNTPNDIKRAGSIPGLYTVVHKAPERMRLSS